MEALVLIGRILFSLIFIGAGIGHLPGMRSREGRLPAVRRFVSRVC